MRNESNTITGRTCQMSGNTSSRMHSGDVSRNRRIVVRRQKIALVSVAFIALAIIICTFLSGAVRTQAAPSEISCKYYTSIEVQSGDTLWSIASDHITEEYRDMNAYIDEVCSINKISQNEIPCGTISYHPILQQYCHCRAIKWGCELLLEQGVSEKQCFFFLCRQVVNLPEIRYNSHCFNCKVCSIYAIG